MSLEGQEVREPRAARWPILLAGTLLACLVGVVFVPILGFDFADMDVPAQVINNPAIRDLSAENLKEMFTTWGNGGGESSYYPARTLTYAVDYQLWRGLNPRGFKLTNLLIHLVNVLLVFWLVLRIVGHPAAGDTSPNGAWHVLAATFSAGVFALHPVVVEPVTWVAGREELLMTLGALGCLHFHLCARRLGEQDGRRRAALACHAAAAFCCAIACLSNAVAAIIPWLITAWDMLSLRPPKWRRILWGTSALWAIGVATVLIKKSGYSAATTKLPGVFSGQWLMIVLNVYWLNLKALVWPDDLAVHYDWPRPGGVLDPEVILGGMALGLTGWLLWGLRRRKVILFGLLWFGLALAPTSQIMPHHIVRADRFLYLPLVGLAVAIAAGLRRLGKVGSGRGATVAGITAGVLAVLLLGMLSARQVRTWRDPVSIWENCLHRDPNNAFAHENLARNLADRGESQRALWHFQAALEISPNFAAGLSDFGRALAKFEDRRLRDYDLAVRLAQRACELSDWRDRRMRRNLAMVHCDCGNDLQARGEFARARRQYREAIQADPEYELPFFSLALLLATCEDEDLRQPDAAVRLAERGWELLEAPDAHRLLILAAVYAEAGRFREAAAAAGKALPLAQAAGDRQMAEDLRRRLEHYRSQIRRDSAGD